MLVSYRYFRNAGRIRCKGVAIFGHELVNVFIKPRIKLEPCFETQEFIYFHNNKDKIYSLSTALSIALQIIIQNYPATAEKHKICEVVSSSAQSTSLREKTNLDLEKYIYLELEYRQINLTECRETFDILIISKIVLSEMNGINLLDFLDDGGFLIYHGCYEDIKKFSLDLIFECLTDEENIYLLRSHGKSMEYRLLEVRSDSPMWMDDLKQKLKSDESETFLLYCEKEENNGIIGLTKRLINETSNIRSLRIDDKIERIDLNQDHYKCQLRKDLLVNVLRDGRWGTYVNFPLVSEHEKVVLNASLTVKTVGDLSSLAWEESPIQRW